MSIAPLSQPLSPFTSAGRRTGSPLAGRIFGSTDEMDQTLRNYGDGATQRYQRELAGTGPMTVDALKAEIGKRFSAYELTESDPGEAVRGRSILYIDKSNLQKMAGDSDYRARVFGLIDREMQGVVSPMSVRTPSGVNTMTSVGSVFSLSDSNPMTDGIPYVGQMISEGVATVTSDEATPRRSGSDKGRGKGPGSRLDIHL